MKERVGVCSSCFIGLTEENGYSKGMSNLQLVVVAVFTFSLIQTGAPQCDGEKYKYDGRFPNRSLACVSLVTLGAHVQQGYGSWVHVCVCYSTSHFTGVRSSHKGYDLLNGQ